jgi:Fuc2NAc and GlcNAc transferase
MLILLTITDGLAWNVVIALVGGGLLVSVVGFYDDREAVPAKVRLLVHFIAAIWALAWLGGMPSIGLGASSWEQSWWGQIIGVVALVWMVNLYNFMDGIDGLAGAETVFVGGFAGVLLMLTGAPDLGRATWVLAAACLGFLFWNWPPSRIFMGDVGSGFLGFAWGVLAIAGTKRDAVPFWAWLVLLSVFIIDATLTLWLRLLRGKRWYEAHRTHAYQHAAQRWGHFKVTLAIILINLLWVAPCATVVTFGALLEPRVRVALVSLVPLIAIALYFKAGRADPVE